jgi:hypothetical protein
VSASPAVPLSELKWKSIKLPVADYQRIRPQLVRTPGRRPELWWANEPGIPARLRVFVNPPSVTNLDEHVKAYVSFRAARTKWLNAVE